jgi:glycine/D-amino acid oxidase-like deaminating enzyme
MAEDLGVKFLLRTMVQKVERDSKGIHVLHTTRGLCRTRKIVYATNGYSAAIAEVAKDWVFPVRGQIVSTKPQSSWLFPSNVCVNDGYEYMIQRKSDHRIILGGMRWKAESASKEKGIFDDSYIDPTVCTSLACPWPPEKSFTDPIFVEMY